MDTGWGPNSRAWRTLRSRVRKRRSSGPKSHDRNHAVLTILVVDGNPDAVPVQRSSAESSRAGGSAGQGLLIVDAMADRWGYHRSDEGKVVWATFSIV